MRMVDINSGVVLFVLFLLAIIFGGIVAGRMNKNPDKYSKKAIVTARVGLGAMAVLLWVLIMYIIPALV